jgi:hypothetical protein
MKTEHCFNGQSEYNSFLAWAINGSCLEQRMQESSGGIFEIPDYWFYWRQKMGLNSETSLQPNEMILPSNLNRYNAETL